VVGMFAALHRKFALFTLLLHAALLFPSLTDVGSNVDSPLKLAVASPVNLTVTQGGEAVRTAKIEIRNNGDKALEWTASANQAWLRFVPAQGSLAPKEATSVDLMPDPAGFAPGIYSASAQVSSKAGSQSFVVTMTEQSAFAGVPIEDAERTLPPDSGMVNVKTDYGAKGDGISDDTEAILCLGRSGRQM
jgi:hypothetical protein